MRRYIQTILRRWNCELAIEQTGADAISRAAVFQPDIAFLGFVTPGINGAQALIAMSMALPGTQIVIFNESVPADILSNLRAQRYDLRTLAVPFTEEELWDLCFYRISKRNKGRT
jgi:CheY-like chemotaxis protein